VPGDVVTWRLFVGDYSDRVGYNHVVARAVLGPHMTLVPESVRLVNLRGDKQLADAPAFAGGFDIGNFAPGGGEDLLFDTRLDRDFAGCTVRIRTIGYVRADGLPETPPAAGFGNRRVSADVVIGKARC
jgi:hypothetical protein